jgi:type IV secretory pathway VirB10-like protein
MTDPQIHDLPKTEPELRRRMIDPRGVLQKNLKPLLYLGAAVLVILAALFSSQGKKTPSQQASKNIPPQPTVQDNTDNNIQDLRNQIAAERQKEAEQAQLTAATANDPMLTVATPAQRVAANSYGANGQPFACAPGQPCPQPQPYTQASGGQPQPSPEQQAAQQLAAKERERAFESRFSSNLAYVRQADQRTTPSAEQSALGAAPSYGAAPSGTSLVPARQAGEQVTGQTAETQKRAQEVSLDSAYGQPYVIFEGATLDTVLMNRLDGDAVGPVKVLVSNPLYSHDHQHVLVPDGTIVLGEAKKIGSAGFRQQRRIAVVFHRMIMPDGYTVDLDQFQGLDQIGEQGLKDKVNNHYLQIFGTSIALGVIAGAAEGTQGGGSFTGSGVQMYTSGAAASTSQSATDILDRFMQIPPTITIREGHRVKVYFTQDLLLPAYERHTIPSTF